MAAATRSVFREGDTRVVGLGGCRTLGVKTCSGFGKLLASVACWWDWMQSRAQGWTSHTHVPWEELVGGICPPNPLWAAHPLPSWGTQALALPLATCHPAICERAQPLQAEVSEATGLSGQWTMGKNRNFASGLSHGARPPRRCAGAL